MVCQALYKPSNLEGTHIGWLYLESKKGFRTRVVNAVTLYGCAGGQTAEKVIGTKERGRIRWMKKFRKEKLIRSCNGKT